MSRLRCHVSEANVDLLRLQALASSGIETCPVLVWVTGNAGVGKSSVCEVVRSRWVGLSLDADWDGFNYWVHRQTGERVEDPPYPTPSGWLAEFGWQIDRRQVEFLHEQSRHGRWASGRLTAAVRGEALGQRQT